MPGITFSGVRDAWRQFTQPSNRTHQETIRHFEGLSVAVLLALFLAALVFGPLWVIADSEYPEAPYLATALILAFGAAYGLGRTKYDTLGKWVAVLALPVFAVAIFFTTTGPMAERLLGLNLMIISILLVMIFFGRRGTIIFAVVSVLGIASFALVPGVSIVLPLAYVVPMVGMTALLIVISTIVENVRLHLRESEERYFSLFKQSNDAVFILDLDGRHRNVNRRAAELFGYSREDLIGLSYRDLVAPSDQPQSHDILRRILDGEHIPPYERIFCKKDGTQLPVEVNVEIVRDHRGQPTHIQSIVRDISERKDAEQALREREEYLRTVIANAPSGMHFYCLAADGRLLLESANPAADHILGIDHRDLIGKSIEEAFPGLRGTAFTQHFKDIAQNAGSLRENELAYRDKRINGLFELQAFQTMPGCIAVFFIDITARKRAEQHALALAVEKERITILKQFVENAAHELRTPLAIINTKTFLVEKAPTDEARFRHAENIRAQTARLVKLLEMMNHMVMLDSHIPLVLQTVDVNNLLRQAIARSGPAATEKSLVVEIESDEPVLCACVDVGWFEEAIQNLVDNAVRFTPPQGSITAHPYERDENIIIEIRDTGAGISEEALPHIFERFWREDDAHSTPGFGLGLSIAQKVVEHHNGRIEVESSQDKGSTFRVILPNGVDVCDERGDVFS